MKFIPTPSIKKIFLKLQSLSPFIKDVIIIASLILIVIFTYKTLIYAPNTSVLGDGPRFNGYFAMQMKRSLMDFGQLGLWNPSISSGMSFISYSSGVHFSPIAWLTVLLFSSSALAANFMEIMYIVFAVIFFYSLLRVLQVSRITSTLITIPYVANQYPLQFIANGWFEELMGIFLLPATVCFYWLAVTRRNYFYVICAAVIMSLHFFDNSYYVLHYNLIVLLWVALLLGIRTFFAKNENKSKKIKNIRDFIFINAFFAITFIGISAIKLIPLLEFYRLSARSIVSLSFAELDTQGLSVLTERLRNFFIPSTFLNNPLIQWTNNGAVLSFGIGALYLFLKRRFIYLVFFSLFILASWSYLANKVNPDLYAFFYYFLPGFSSNRLPYRFFIIIHFAYIVCIALGLDLLINNSRHRTARVMGIIIGFIFVIASVYYIVKAFPVSSVHISNDLEGALSRSQTKVEIYKDFSIAPLIQKEDDQLLVNLTKLFNAYWPEGRAYLATTSYTYANNAVTNKEIFIGNIDTISHPYDKITTTYKYDYVKPGLPKDSLETTINRYKMLSILNARFHFHQLGYSEFLGCENLRLPNEISKVDSLSPDVCKFLINRIVPLIVRKDGGIYYDKNVIPKVSIIPKPILVISDNRFNDFSGFIAKKIIFNKDFNEKKITVFSSDMKTLEDFSIDELSKFYVVILVDPEIKNKGEYERRKREYEKNGKLIELNSKWINYESLHERSGSIWTDKPAWSYSEEDNDKLSLLFKSITKDDSSSNITIKKFTPEDLIFEVQTSKDNMALQFSDSYYPGWKAELDGKKVQVYMADGLVKGVIIPQRGKHIVRMRYSPDSLKNGAAITIATISMLLALGLYIGKKKKGEITKRIIDIIRKTNLFFYRKTYMNLFKASIKEFKRPRKHLLAYLVLLFLFILFSPIFFNNVSSAGDLPYYWDGYFKTFSLPLLWNPHWPTGLGGNQTIILPLKLYVQFLVPYFSNLGLTWEIFHKIIFSAVFIALSVLSSFLLTKSWVGSLIYSTNTWILMVFSGGQMGIALAYAFIPFLLMSFQKLFEKLNPKNALFFSLICSLELVFDQRITLLTLGVILFLFIFQISRNTFSFLQIRKKLLYILLIPVTIIGLNAYWIFSLILSKLASSPMLQVLNGGTGQLSFFSFAFFENTLSLLHPNWPENIFGKTYFMKPEFIIIPILAFGSLLFLKNKNNKNILSYALLGLIGAFLAKGTNEPFGFLYTWFFENVPGFSLFRDPTKFYILIALAYAMLIPFTIDNISNKIIAFTKHSRIIISIIFIIFWGFTIREVLLKDVNGLFKESKIPKEYVNLKDYIEPQKDFSRTLWIPARQRFGYFSDNHPAIDGYDIFGRISASSMAAKLENKNIQKMITDLSIKYVIIPFDSQGEIFLTDRKYDDMLWSTTIDKLDENKRLNKSLQFGKIRAYEVPGYYGHFYIKQANGGILSNISYKKENNSRYLVSIKEAKEGDVLVFSESYDLGWQAMAENLKIFPIPYSRLLNGFVLPEDGNYSLEVRYIPQKAVNIGYIVSGISLLVVGVVVILAKK